MPRPLMNLYSISKVALPCFCLIVLILYYKQQCKTFLTELNHLSYVAHPVTCLQINIFMPSRKSSCRRMQLDQMFIALQNYIENESFDYLFVVGDFTVTLLWLDSYPSPVKSIDCRLLLSKNLAITKLP